MSPALPPALLAALILVLAPAALMFAYGIGISVLGVLRETLEQFERSGIE